MYLVVCCLTCIVCSLRDVFSPNDVSQKMAGDGGRDGGGSAGQGQGAWKLDVARQVLVEDYGPRLDWVAVAKALDHERFNVPDQVSRV